MKTKTTQRSEKLTVNSEQLRNCFPCASLTKAEGRKSTNSAIVHRSPLNVKSLIVHCSLLIVPLSVPSAVPLTWQVDTTRVAPVTFDAYHGETLALEAVLKDASRPLDLTGKTARLYWQTNGMESVYWTTNATVSATNHIAATFTGAMDPGAASVRGFLGIAGENYRASFVIRFRPSPGYAPGAIVYPPKTLDLAHTVVVNPPWPTQADYAATTTVMRAELKDYVDAQIEGAGVVSPTTVTNIVEAKIAAIPKDGVSTNAVNFIISEAARTNWLCTVAAADENYLTSKSPYNQEVTSIHWTNECELTGKSFDLKLPNNLKIEAWERLKLTGGQTIQQYLDTLEWQTKDERTLEEYGITNAYTKAEASEKFVEYGGAYYANANGMENSGSSISLFDNEIAFRLENYEVQSELHPDGSHVATSNMVERIATNFVCHTNTRFSNEVLAVGLGIGTNEVAQINAILADTGGTPDGGAATVGGLLAALALAVAWLKKNLRYANGGASSATMADRTTNVYTLNTPDATVTLSFPAAVNGRMRDFLLDLTYTAGTLALPSGVTKVGDELTFTAGKEYVIAFTEIAANRFYVRCIEIA